MNHNQTNSNSNGWSVLFNVPNTIAWIRIVLLFISIRYFGQKKYLLFVIYHTVSGFLDSLDGILARSLAQQSIVGRYFEIILDQYSHFIIYAFIGFLYPSYIVYFYIEIAAELWNSTYDMFIHSIQISDESWLDKKSILAPACSISIHNNPNLRLLNWYGPDIFHTFLIIRYFLLNDNDRKLTACIKHYISIDKLLLLLRVGIVFGGFFSVLRTYVTSCYMVDNLFRLAQAK